MHIFANRRRRVVPKNGTFRPRPGERVDSVKNSVLYLIGKDIYHPELLLEIRFKDKKLRELCEKRAVAEKKLGSACARKLRARLDDLDAAERVSELTSGNPHPLKGDRQGQFALDLHGGWRLVFAPANDPVPARDDRSIDWSLVTIICIEYIGDYHD